MRVLINALALKPQMGGGLTFGLGLARALGQTAGSHEVVLLCGDHNLDLLAKTGCPVTSLGPGLDRAVRRVRFERFALAPRLTLGDDDLFITLDGTLPANLKCAQLAIFQNLIYFQGAEVYAGSAAGPGRRAYAHLQARYFLSSWRRTARRADRVVFPSNAARMEFSRHYPELEGKSAVIFEGTDPVFVPGDGPDLDRPHMLGVGTLYEHKRMDLLIDLLAAVTRPAHLRLKIVGADWAGSLARLQRYAREQGVADRVDFLGHLEIDKLASLYRRALCVGHFSTVEAFGLPVAEALACGVPVVVADRSAMPEIGESGAFVVTLGALQNAADFVTRLHEDPDFRAHWRQRAQQRAPAFHWNHIAGQYWALIDETARVHRAAGKRTAAMPNAGERLEGIYRRLPLGLQTVAVNVAGLRNRRTRFGEPFWAELKFLEKSEKYSASELASLQADRLQALVRTAYEHVPYYRELFRSLKLTPADIRTPDDLARLPVLDKATVAARAAEMVNTSLPSRARIPGRTSGSTGTSLALVHDARALAAEFATVWRMRRRFGCDLDRWHATFAGRLFVPQAQRKPPYHRVNYVQKQLLFSLYHLSPATVPHYADALARWPCEFYTGYPSALEVLVQDSREAGVTLPGPARALFTSSETLLAHQKESLERTLGVPVYDRYGCAEFCVSFTVCEQGRYHLDSEFSIVEWETLEETADSFTGALICTGLMNHAMPFIRYRVGDVATLATTPCPCGKASLSAFSIDGRREDFVVTAEGVRLGRLDHIFKDLHSIRESQILQSEPGRITIRVVRGPEYRPADEKRLLAECRKRMGGATAVAVEYTDAIPRNAAGKFRAVINTMKEAQRYEE